MPRIAECRIDDRDPLVLLDGSNMGRVTELIIIRYGRMIASPFEFYRGAAPLMAYDLSKLPNSDVFVQLGGDAHLANFGLFASHERRILLDRTTMPSMPHGLPSTQPASRPKRTTR